MTSEEKLVNSIIYYVLKMNLEQYSIDLKNIIDVPYGEILYYVIDDVKNVPKKILINNIIKYINTINIASLDISLKKYILTIKRAI